MASVELSPQPCSEDALGDLEALLLHAWQRGAGHVFGPACPGEATLLQDKVIVGRRVHGVEDVGVVRDSQLCGIRTQSKRVRLLRLCHQIAK